MALIASSADAQGTSPRVILQVSGAIPAARLGLAVSPAGDLNGDGRPDFAMGAPGWGPGGSDSTGRVLIYFGGRGLGATPDLVLTGLQRGAQFGYAIAPVGDVNADGYDDLIVTAPSYAYPDPQRQGSGRVYLYFGGYPFDGIADVVFDSPVMTYYTNAVTGFGSSVIGLGDASGDRIPDWSVGFDRSSSNAFGGVATYLGGLSIAIPPVSFGSNPSAGRPVLAAPGDMNGDGLADLVIAGPTGRNGSAFVGAYYGAANGPYSQLNAWTSATSDGFGAALAPAGDLNGDGLMDLYIGHPQVGGGSVSIWYGSRTFEYINRTSYPIGFGGTLPDSFGCSLAAGTVEGGNTRALLVGACGDRVGGPGAGAAFLYRMNGTATTLLKTMRGAAGEYLGYRVAIPGDADGDGKGDLLVGSPLGAQAGPASGIARVAAISPLALAEPQGPAEWPAGGTATVRWSGAALARISLSLDDGANWQTLRDNVGGLTENQLALGVPDTVTARARVRVSIAGSLGDAFNSDVSDCSISIVRAAAAIPAAVRLRDALGDRGGSGVAAAIDATGRLGAALAGGGDLDGDGRPDVAVGAPFTDAPAPNAGAVWIVGGDGVPRRVTGEAGGALFGTSVAINGDAGGDGRADLLVGAPGVRVDGARTGCAYLYRDGDTSAPPLRLRGTREGEEFGAAVCWVGDLNRDGYDDFAVAAPYYASPLPRQGTGRVLVYFGGQALDDIPDMEWVAPYGMTGFGEALAALDLNGDGAADLAVSARGVNGGPGRVYVFLGGSSPRTRPDLELRGTSGNDRFGAVLARAGDLNGDGFDDLLVGAPGAANTIGATGRVYEFIGGSRPANTPLRVFDGSEADEEFGAAVAGVGDVNGDGRDDFVVGAPRAAFGKGACRLYLGGSDAEPDGEWLGAAAGERLGSSVAGAGDTDGDGLAEVLAGSPLYERGAGLGTGRVVRLDAPRYVVESPAPAERWFAGGLYTLKWRGAEPAAVALSVDAGRTWVTLAGAAGGASANALELRAPTVTTDSAYVRVRASRAGLPRSEVMRGPIGIGRSARLARFDYTLGEDGIRLAWSAEPGIGPEGWSGYRLYREAAEAGGTRERVGPERIEVESFVVAEFERGGTYALVGVDGNGQEAELGRVTVAAPGAKLRAWPVPSGEWGNVELAVYPPVDGSGRTAADFAVMVYDLNGRAVRRVTGGVMATRVGEVRLSWDRRVTGGWVAGPGVYFVRAESPSRGFRIERRIVLLK